MAADMTARDASGRWAKAPVNGSMRSVPGQNRFAMRPAALTGCKRVDRAPEAVLRAPRGRCAA
jgi:hypothetical protein